MVHPYEIHVFVHPIHLADFCLLWKAPHGIYKGQTHLQQQIWNYPLSFTRVPQSPVNEKSPTPFINKSTASRIKKITRRTDQKIPFCPRSGNSPGDRNNVNRPPMFIWPTFFGVFIFGQGMSPSTYPPTPVFQSTMWWPRQCPHFKAFAQLGN